MHDAIGRTQSHTDVLDLQRAVALYAVLGQSSEGLKNGAPLIAFAHQIYFWNIEPATNLGFDGHPKLGGFIPDLGLANRMWAGGRLRFLAPLIVGRKATKVSTIENVEHKEGRSGSMAFVTIRHEITQNDRLAVTEWQDLVYLAASHKPKRRHQEAPKDEDLRLTARFPETTLFRYSALTFNAHRIHYDHEFCRTKMGLKGPAVHGPLLAQMLMLLAEDQLDELRSFEFRAIRPLLAGEAVDLCWRSDGSLWARGPNAQIIVQAKAG